MNGGKRRSVPIVLVFILVGGVAGCIVVVSVIAPLSPQSSGSGLQLTISVSSNTVGFYQKFAIKSDLWDSSDKTYNASARPLPPGFASPCSTAGFDHAQIPWPYGIEVLSGRYDLGNFTQANSQALETGAITSPSFGTCSSYARSQVSSYAFPPGGGLATVEYNDGNIFSIGLNFSVTANLLPATGSFYSLDNATASYAFTVVAEDEWGDVSFAYVTAAGPWGTDVTVSCDSPSLLLGSSGVCEATLGESLGAPEGNITWSATGEGNVSFYPEVCTTLPYCSVKITGTSEGVVNVTASYSGDAYQLPSKGENVTFVSDPSLASRAIVQHEYFLPDTAEPLLNVNLSRPVSRGDLLVVGVVSDSNSTGRVSDSFGDAWTASTYSDATPNLGVGVWWTTAKATGNDTVTIGSGGSAELVELFELRGANMSTVSAGGTGEESLGGAESLTTVNNTVYVASGGAPCSYEGGCIDDGDGVFILMMAGATHLGMEECVVWSPALVVGSSTQTLGLKVEPYCGGISPLSGNDVFGAYATTDYPATQAFLHAAPPFDSWEESLIFTISINLNSSAAG